MAMLARIFSIRSLSLEVTFFFAGAGAAAGPGGRNSVTWFSVWLGLGAGLDRFHMMTHHSLLEKASSGSPLSSPLRARRGPCCRYASPGTGGCRLPERESSGEGKEVVVREV